MRTGNALNNAAPRQCDAIAEARPENQTGAYGRKNFRSPCEIFAPAKAVILHLTFGELGIHLRPKAENAQNSFQSRLI